MLILTGSNKTLLIRSDDTRHHSCTQPFLETCTLAWTEVAIEVELQTQKMDYTCESGFRKKTNGENSCAVSVQLRGERFTTDVDSWKRNTPLLLSLLFMLQFLLMHGDSTIWLAITLEDISFAKLPGCTMKD